MIISTGIQHIGIIVPDADKTAQWYEKSAGYKRKAEFYHEGSKVVFVYSENTSALIELIQRPDGSEVAEIVKKSGGFIDHIAYSVDDIEKEFDTAKKLNLEIIEGIVHIPEFWDKGFSYFLLKSAGGEKVEYCKIL